MIFAPPADFSLSGLQSHLQRLNRTAARLASFSPDTELEAGMVQVIIDRRGFQANAAVIRTVDEMVGSLLDVLA